MVAKERLQGRSATVGPPGRSTLVFLWILGVAGLTRLATAALVLSRPAPPSLGEVLGALAAGPLADLRAAVWLTLPWWLAAALLPRSWHAARPLAWLARAAMAAVFFGTLFVAAAEIFFFEDFRSRFNFVAVDYLLYPTEVGGNIWESYPTGWILAGLATASVAALLALERRRARLPAGPQPALWTRLRPLALALAFAVASAIWYPSVPHLSSDREIDELAENGYVTFWRALLGDGETYQGLYPETDAAAALERVQQRLDPGASAAGGFARDSTTRRVAATAGPHARNVVVVLEESFGSEFVRSLAPAYPYPVDLAPELERVAAQGTLFTHALSTGNRTIRAIEATTSGLPPLPGVSIVRRSASTGLFTLPGVLAEHGYRTEFVYGGRALFDEVGPYLERNGVGRVVDQADFPDTAFRTAWGVCDEAILDRALVEMDELARSGSPFYLLALTVSNHRPYHFPQDAVRWDPRMKARPNAVRYADHALGRFFDALRTRPYFDETLLVVMGDHGTRVYGAAEIPLASYEVPVVFVGPGVAPAGTRDDSLASSLDIPPTILGALGIDYASRFFGRDLFHSDPAAGRAFLTHNSTIALLEGDRLAVLGLRHTQRLYRVGWGRDALEPLPESSAADRDLMADAVAFYQTADELYRSGRYTLVPRTIAHRMP
jgi:phosphoglycerol transferase MdoB-like AlkP superfamily enzyme